MSAIDELRNKLNSNSGGATPAAPAQSGSSIDSLRAKLSAGTPTPSPAPAVQTPKPEVATEKKDDDRNLWEKTMDFLGFTTGKAAAGVAEGVEGIVNTVGYYPQLVQKSAMQQAAGGAAMAAAFSKDPLVDEYAKKQQTAAQEDINKEMKTIANFGDKATVKAEEKYADIPLSKATRFVGDVAQGVGGMATTILGNIVVPGLGTAAMVASAFGNSVQEAQKQGAGAGEAAVYGLANSAIEFATEKVFGGMKINGKEIFGTGLLDKAKDALVKKASNGAARASLNTAFSFIGEGLEEFAAEYGQSLANRLTINTEDREWSDVRKDAFRSALIGGTIGGLLNVGSSIEAGKSVTVKEAADIAATEAAKEINETIATQGEISPSGGVSSQPTTDATAAENIGRDNQGMPGFESNENVAGDDGLGAANADFTINKGEQVPTQNKTVTDSKYMTDEEKAMLSPGTHERISEAESINRAQQNFYTDSDGSIVNLDFTVEDLLAKDAWTGVDQDTAQIAMMELVRRARETGDYSKVMEFGQKIEAVGATEAGRSLQARQKWVGKSGTNIMIAATEAVASLPEAEQNAALNEVAQLAGEFDEVLNGKVNPKRKKQPKQKVEFVDEVDTKLDAKREVDGLVELIRRTAQIRQTTGLFSKDLSKAQEWALKHIAESGDVQFLRDFAANNILSIATDKQRRSAGEWITTYRRQAMLSKAATIMRNLVSNGVFDIVDTVARDIVVPLDIALSKRTGTRSVAADKYYFSKAKRQGTMDGLAKSLLEVGLDVDASGNLGRYESTSNRTAKMSGGIVSKLFSTWEKYGGYGLITTDAAAKGGTSAEIQRGIDELYNKGLIKDDSLDEAGKTEAEYRTFQDETKLSGFTLDVRRDLDKRVKIGGENGVGLGTMAIPFAKTPTNLATRAVEYSPAGLIKGGVDIAKIFINGKKGKYTAADQAKAIQEVGRGVTGSALIGLSIWGALTGVIKTIGDGSEDDDKDKTAFEKMTGQNGTQWNLSAFARGLSGGSTEWQDDDVLMSISFLEPINSHLTAGALIAEDIRNDEFTFKSIMMDSVEGALRSILDMPVMSALKSAVQEYQYSKGDGTTERAINTALAYGAGQVSSFIPNAVKGFAQGTDPIQRNAYTADTLVGQTWDNVKASLPGLRQTVDAKVDSYGNPMETEGGVLGFLNSNILPGQITHYREQTGQSVIDYLYEITGNAGVYPDRKAPNKIDTTIGGKTYNVELDGDTKQEYLQTAGQAHEELLAAIEADPEFQSLTTEQQVEIVNAARLKAQQEAKLDVFHSNGINPKQSKVDKVKEQMSPSEYIDWLIADTKAVTPDGYAEGSTPQWQQFEIALSLPDSLAVDMIIAQGGDTGRRISAAVDNGISVQRAVEYYRATSERNAEGKSPSKGEVNQRLAAAGFTADERRIMRKAFELTFK